MRTLRLLLSPPTTIVIPAQAGMTRMEEAFNPIPPPVHLCTSKVQHQLFITKLALGKMRWQLRDTQQPTDGSEANHEYRSER